MKTRHEGLSGVCPVRGGVDMAEKRKNVSSVPAEVLVDP